MHLNPGDNQGNRYALLDLLIQIERYEEARRLRGGKKILQQAVEENPFAPAHLMGQKRVPNRQVDYYDWGDESEAIYYASEHLNYWRRIPGAVEWLRTEIATGTR